MKYISFTFKQAMGKIQGGISMPQNRGKLSKLQTNRERGNFLFTNYVVML